jgi:hypothetical protein
VGNERPDVEACSKGGDAWGDEGEEAGVQRTRHEEELDADAVLAGL